LSSIFEKRLSRFCEAGQQPLVKACQIGIEKETLRVSPPGHIAQTPHPTTLGSALTHPYITTDYSEALLEFITPPSSELQGLLGFLRDIHQFVYQNIDAEMLWATSMPCVLKGESSIPIARYGSSNAGRMKHIYRVGLGYRYGRIMQVIAGVHFNFSPADEFWPVFQEHEKDRRSLRAFRDYSYFCLIRNLQRFGWLVPYLFGASPAVCKSFLAGKPTSLVEFDANTYTGPFATSLRMSDIGYTNIREKKTGLNISYSNLDEYIATLTWAIETPCPDYEKIGVKVAGEYRQLNANILQIENEYYSTMRPKQPPQGNEKPTLALRRRGVQYVELRSLDVNPFAPLGVYPEQLRFLQAFLLFCLFHESPPIDGSERQEIDYNQMAVANQGRDPKLLLHHSGRALSLSNWAMQILDALEGLCEILDTGETDRPYTRILDIQRETVRDPDRTPSARVLAEMRANQEGFFQFAKRVSLQHRAYFRGLPLDPERSQYFQEQARQSLALQQAMEAADEISFDEYLRQYFAQS
jgi:glutamate--cysteine ligase